jgi:hypothetical protein
MSPSAYCCRLRADRPLPSPGMGWERTVHPYPGPMTDPVIAAL